MTKNVVCKKCNNLVNDWCEKVIDSPDPDMQRDCQYFCKEETPIELVQEWISVKDKLPEFPGHYLVCTSINYWHGGCMDINENHKYHPNGTPVGYDGSTMSVLDCYYDVTGHWNRVCDSHVTHWMPLPPPPEGE